MARRDRCSRQRVGRYQSPVAAELVRTCTWREQGQGRGCQDRGMGTCAGVRAGSASPAGLGPRQPSPLRPGGVHRGGKSTCPGPGRRPCTPAGLLFASGRSFSSPGCGIERGKGACPRGLTARSVGRAPGTQHCFCGKPHRGHTAELKEVPRGAALPPVNSLAWCSRDECGRVSVLGDPPGEQRGHRRTLAQRSPRLQRPARGPYDTRCCRMSPRA